MHGSAADLQEEARLLRQKVKFLEHTLEVQEYLEEQASDARAARRRLRDVFGVTA